MPGLQEYLTIYLKDFEEEEKASAKDPRLISRKSMRTLESEPVTPSIVLTGCSRILNQFPLSLETKEGPLYPFDANQLPKLIELYNAILQQKIEFDESGFVYNFATAQKIEKFISEIIVLACNEVLDEQGNIKQSLKKLLGISKLEKKLEKIPSKLEEMNFQFICGFCSQLIFGAAHKAWEKKYYAKLDARGEADKVGAVTQILLKYFQATLPDRTGVPSPFFVSKMRDYTFLKKTASQQCAELIQDISPEQLQNIVSQDLAKTPGKLTTELLAEKQKFWESVQLQITDATFLGEESELSKAITYALTHRTKVEVAKPINIAPEKLNAISEQLRIRDNSFYIDNIVTRIAAQKTWILEPHEAKELAQLQAAKKNRTLMILPSISLLESILIECNPESRLAAFLDTYIKQIAPTSPTGLFQPVKEAKEKEKSKHESKTEKKTHSPKSQGKV